MLWAALEHYEGKFDTSDLPIELEKDKQARRLAKGDQTALRPEQVRAMRQNLNNPGKVITIAGSKGLPYEGVSDLLVVADSSNNRYLIFDLKTLKCLD